MKELKQNEMEKPHINDYYIIEYGITHKNQRVVKVIEEKELFFTNWRIHDFKCELENGELVTVTGSCFKEKIAK